jgi:hypothetical protein
MLHRFIIRTSSLLVPAMVRLDWRREWDAELWYVSTELQGWELWRFSRGAIADAVWHLWNLSERDALALAVRRRTESAVFCLASIAAMICAVIVASGFLPRTRDIVVPLPYVNADRIATVARSGMALATRAEVPASWVQLWDRSSRLTEGAAAYRWEREILVDPTGKSTQVLSAHVTGRFFSLLGPRISAGRLLAPGDAADCPECAVLDYSFAHDHSLAVGSRLVLAGSPRRVVGILDKRFWFVSREIAVWSLGSFRDGIGVGAIVRLRPEVDTASAETELERVVQDSGVDPWRGMVSLTLLQERVRFVFGSFVFAVAMALVITLVGLRVRVPGPVQCRAALHGSRPLLRAVFFAGKNVLLLTAVLLAGIEFTRAPSITMIGGTDALTEPLSTWLFLMASMGVFSWSIHDQRRRCRVCHRRLGLPAHVGCRGCLLLDWSGTEMVCIHGHGILHIPEMLSSLQEAEQWTSLDDSWQGLFAG